MKIKCDIQLLKFFCCPCIVVHDRLIKSDFFVRNGKNHLSPCCQFHWDDIHKLKAPRELSIIDQFSQISLQDGEQEYLNQMKEFAVRRLVYNDAVSKEKAKLVVANFYEEKWGFPKDLMLEMLNSEK